VKIQLRLHGPLQKYGKSTGYFEMELVGRSYTIREIIFEAGVPASAVSFVSVDGIKQSLDFTLKGGEKVTVYSHVVGG
jgi:sulfur-carrier protein